MHIDRQQHWQFFEDELRAETEVFNKKFEAKAEFLLKETEEMFVGQFLAFRDGEMLMKFPNTRNLPRKGDFLYCMLLPDKLRNYHNWGNKTYQDLYNVRHKGTECTCIWHSSYEDKRFSLVGFRKVDIDFANIIKEAPGIILIFAPQRPPIEYIVNLQRLTTNNHSKSVSFVLDFNYQKTTWSPTLIKANNVAEFVRTQLLLSDTMILQGPPGTGKTYMLAELCKMFCKEGKSVLVTALTNRALMEIATKPSLQKMLEAGNVMKTNMTTDEKKELNDLIPIKQVNPIAGSLILSTYFITSGFASELTFDGAFDVVIMDEASQALTAMFAAAKKIGKTNLWVGDICQLPPIVALNDDIIHSKGYNNMIDGLKLLTEGSMKPIYQLTSTYRFGQRAADYTGIFYKGTLFSKITQAHYSHPLINNFINHKGGPALLMTDLTAGDYTPEVALTLTTIMAASIMKGNNKKKLAVLTCMIKTAKALQKYIIQNIGTHSNILIETIARVQGLTTDITILIIPNTSYMRTLEPRLFNVATSRAKEHTIIIVDKNILNYPHMNINVRCYLEKLYHEQMQYIPLPIIKQLYKDYVESL